MINDPTILIFEFDDGAPQEVDGVALGTLLGALETLIVRAGRGYGVLAADFMHVAPPHRGSLRFSFKVKVEGQVHFPTGQRNKDGLLSTAADLAGVAGLLVALFAPNGAYDLFHKGSAMPEPAPPVQAVMTPLMQVPASDNPLWGVREAAEACGAARVLIQVPDHEPVELSPIAPTAMAEPTGHPADGDWDMQIQTPMGPQELRVHIEVMGDRFVGRSEGKMGAQEISGVVSGDELTWQAVIESPMPMTLTFTVRATRDELQGGVVLGAFGKAPITGRRAP